MKISLRSSGLKCLRSSWKILLHHPAHNYRRPVPHRHQGTRHEADGLERLLLYIGVLVEPVEPDIEAAGGFEEEAGPCIQPEPNRSEEGGIDHRSPPFP